MKKSTLSQFDVKRCYEIYNKSKPWDNPYFHMI